MSVYAAERKSGCAEEKAFVLHSIQHWSKDWWSESTVILNYTDENGVHSNIRFQNVHFLCYSVRFWHFYFAGHLDFHFIFAIFFRGSKNCLNFDCYSFYRIVQKHTQKILQFLEFMWRTDPPGQNALNPHYANTVPWIWIANKWFLKWILKK